MGPFLLGVCLALTPSMLLMAWLAWVAGVFQKDTDKAPDQSLRGY